MTKKEAKIQAVVILVKNQAGSPPELFARAKAQHLDISEPCIYGICRQHQFIFRKKIDGMFTYYWSENEVPSSIPERFKKAERILKSRPSATELPDFGAFVSGHSNQENADDLHTEATEVLKGLVVNAKSVFNVDIELPSVIFKYRGAVGGSANYQNNRITLQHTLYTENRDEYCNQVIPHEFCHLITHKLYPYATAHGREWKMVMLKMGLRPTRTHAMNTENVRYATNRHAYHCDCRTHMITTNLVNKLKRGSGHHCRKCKVVLQVGKHEA